MTRIRPGYFRSVSSAFIRGHNLPPRRGLQISDCKFSIAKWAADQPGGTSGRSRGTPGDSVGTPGSSRRTPGRWRGTPENSEGTPGKLQGTPGKLQGTPGKSVGTHGNSVGTFIFSPCASGNSGPVPWNSGKSIRSKELHLRRELRHVELGQFALGAA